MTVTLRIDRYTYSPGATSRMSDPERLPDVERLWPFPIAPFVGLRICYAERRGTIRGVEVDMATGQIVLSVDEYVERAQ